MPRWNKEPQSNGPLLDKVPSLRKAALLVQQQFGSALPAVQDLATAIFGRRMKDYAIAALNVAVLFAAFCAFVALFMPYRWAEVLEVKWSNDAHL